MFPILTRFFLAGLVACASDPAAQKKEPEVASEEVVVAAPPEVKSEKPNSKKSNTKKSNSPAIESKKVTEKKSAKPKTEKKSDEDLVGVEQKYAAAKSVSMDVKKSLILSLLERTDVSEGRFYVSGKEKLDFEFEKPIKSIAILNGKEFWVIEYPPADVEDKVRVLKSKLGEKSQSQVLITSLLGRGRILDHFKIDSKKKKDGRITFKLTSTGSLDEIKNLEMIINEETKLIVEVSYEDELENKTKFEFSKVEFDGSVPEKLFTYAPPKGAEVNNL